MSWELALLNAFATWKGLKALPGVAHWAEGRIKEARINAIMRDLNTIAFWNEGLLEPLTAIAEGRGEDRHKEILTAKFAQTQKEVDAAVRRLLRVRQRYLSQVLGNPVSRAVGDVV